jgi:hypothetical protein
MSSKEEIEQSFLEAGWELDGSFSGHLVVGEDSELSILAHRQAWASEDPMFELCDSERNLVYWVKGIPTPAKARQMLDEHGKPFEEE